MHMTGFGQQDVYIKCLLRNYSLDRLFIYHITRESFASSTCIAWLLDAPVDFVVA